MTKLPFWCAVRFTRVSILPLKCTIDRDLKPENFLLKDKSDHAPIKIIDFGLSRKDDAPLGIMTSRVGTPYYVAPEVLLNEYNNKVDIWSIGVIAYILLCGFAPFAGDSDFDTLALVASAPLDFPSPEWDEISDEAKDFVSKLLDRDSDTRPTAAEAMKLPWIAAQCPPGIPKPLPFAKRAFSETDRSSLNLDSARLSGFQKFLATIKVRKAMKTVSAVMTPTEAQALGKVFGKVDEDNDGKIRVSDISHAIETGTYHIRIVFNNNFAGCQEQMMNTILALTHVSWSQETSRAL